MPFVKLDTGILDSTLWVDRDCREVFLTALLMAQPHELKEPAPQLRVRAIEPTGFVVPPGWYGHVGSASVGILRNALVPHEQGMAALERLGDPDEESRSADFQGRRLVRVDGGFLVLNYMKYRERDYTSAERQRRYRERKKEEATTESHAVTSQSNAVTSRRVTQADAEADKKQKTCGSATPTTRKPKSKPGAVTVELMVEIMDAFNAALPNLSKVKVITPKRDTLIRKAWNTSPEWQSLDFWRAYFAECNDDPFLNGTGPYREPHANWRPDFDYLLRSDVIAKVYERVMDRLERSQ
jgi:hypothetical protein